MGTQYLIDSNAVIEFLGDMLPSSASNQLQDIVDLNTHHLSVINQIELLGCDAILIVVNFVNVTMTILAI